MHQPLFTQQEDLLVLDCFRACDFKPAFKRVSSAQAAPFNIVAPAFQMNRDAKNKIHYQTSTCSNEED